MKKLLLFSVLLFASMFVKAQDAIKDVEPYYFYCQCRGVMQGIGRIDPKTLIWNGEKSEMVLTDENGKELDFKNMTDVMNYMSKRGWEFDNVYVSVPDGWYYYIFKKKVTSDEEAKAGLYFKTDFK